jgi:hypothetical protein
MAGAGPVALMFGKTGDVYFSENITNWLTVPTATKFNLGSGALYKNSIVVVGDYGTVQQSDPLSPQAPSIALQPTDSVIESGTAVDLQVGAFGTSPIRYQWRFNGLAIPAATNRTLHIDAFGSQSAGTYDAVVENNLGTETSRPARIKLAEPPDNSPPSLAVQLNADGEVILYLTGTPSVNYRIESASELSDPVRWSEEIRLVGSGEAFSWKPQAEPNLPHRFFRAVRE